MESIDKKVENISLLDKIVDNIKSFGNIETEKIEINKEECKKEKNQDYISEHIYIISPN